MAFIFRHAQMYGSTPFYKKAVIVLFGLGFATLLLYGIIQRFLDQKFGISNSLDARRAVLNHGRRNLSYLPILDPVIAPRGFQNSRFLVVILVSSSPLNIQKRNAIRKTWGRQENWDGFGKRSPVLLKHDYRTAFVLGNSASEDITRNIKNEIATNRDIILGNFTDSYMSLNIKVLMALKWSLSIDCEYILKADDDVYVNVPTLSSWLLKQQNKNLYSGFVYWRVAPSRNKNSKHFLTKGLYPRHAFPPYCAGPSYVLSRDLASRILNASRVIHPLRIEDAYMGMLTYYLGVTPLDHDNFRLRFSAISAKELHSFDDCFFLNTFCYGHNLGPKELFHIHDIFRRMNSKSRWQLMAHCLLKDLQSAVGVGARFSLLPIALVVICVGALKWKGWILAKHGRTNTNAET